MTMEHLAALSHTLPGRRPQPQIGCLRLLSAREQQLLEGWQVGIRGDDQAGEREPIVMARGLRIANRAGGGVASLLH